MLKNHTWLGCVNLIESPFLWTMDRRIDKPLYKYFGNLEYAEKAIRNNSIHLEKPADYNDIYDSATVTSGESTANHWCSDIEVSLLFLPICLDNDMQQYLKEYNLNVICKECKNIKEILAKVSTILINKFPSATFENLYEIFLEKMGGPKIGNGSINGISCFSESNNSILMWAYYAMKHAGVCLKYDFDSVHNEYNNIANKLIKVDYTDHISKSKYFNYLFTKSRQWEHEQEWRIAGHFGDEEFVDFPFLSGIILGCRMNESDEKHFNTLACEHGLKLYKAIPSTERYEISIKEIYISNQSTQ